jgi:hypothetical protein
VNSSFTSGAPIDTNVWRTASVSQDAANLVVVSPGQPWWLFWGYPDTGFGLGTKAELGNASVPFKSPAYFTGYDTNVTVIQRTLGARVSTLVPEEALPTLDGLSNGVPGNAAFFLLQKPAPAE